MEDSFAYLQSQGVKVARWFVFSDGRAAPRFGPDGRAIGLGDYFYRDFDAALAIARRYDVHLIPVLFDFTLAHRREDDGGVQVGGRASLADLDFYQFHYYDELDGEYRLDLPPAARGMDRPVVVGELPTQKTRAAVRQYLDSIWHGGYAGGMPWGDSPGDVPSNFREVAREVGAWARNYAGQLDLEPWRAQR